jgi:hypothetical protein
MLIRRCVGAVVAGLACVAVLGVPPAGAVPSTRVKPILVGDGQNAAVTVDPSGTAHIAYNGDEPSENSLHYCRLPRGAKACTVRTTITVAQTSLEHPFVVANGATIQVVSYRYGFRSGSFGQDILFTSRDGGVSFDGGVSVGQNPFHLAIAGPGNAVSTITTADSSDGGTIYQLLPLGGGSAGNARANLSTVHFYDGALGLLAGGTPIATMSDASDNAFWRRYSGSGDPNDAAAWTPEQPIGVARTPHFADGPAGAFLVAGIDAELTSRRWNGNGFDAPVKIPGGNGEVPQGFATQDPGGRLHALLPQITADGSRLLYATSDNGRSWAARQFAFEPFAGQTQVSAAADHRGFATWHSGTGASSQVFALPVGPSAAVPRLGKTAVAGRVRGTVRIKRRGAKRFVKLRGDAVIPVGSIVDAGRGRVRVTTALRRGRQQSADFYQGAFKLTQAKSGLTNLALSGGSFRSCGRSARGAADAARSKRKVVRHLWGSGKGKFRTKGRFSSATVRGTIWETVDRCDGTLVKVKRGRVAVKDFRRHKTVIVKKGRSYLARA